MKTIKIKIYKFDELSEEAKQKAIENERQNEYGITYGAWYDAVEWEFKDKAEKLGYTDIEMHFSGFWSQGDGACFEANVNIAKWLKAHKLSTKYKLLKEWEDAVSIDITHNARYYYATSTNVNTEYAYESEQLKGKTLDRVNDQLEEVSKLIETEREELGNALYRDLESEYESLTSDDVIADYLLTNEYDFLEDGSQHLHI
jgi:TRAP-type mannitol/chloroaromatic compound transport system substrate-binding protein